MRKGDLTRRRILDAATDEFSAYGFAGARIERITSAARVNKSQLYGFFGGKERLFDIVFQEAFEQGVYAIDLPHTDLADYCGAILDHLEHNPSLQRLCLWRQLERPNSAFAGEIERWTEKRSRIEAEQEAGRLRDDVDAGDILALTLAIGQTWFLAPEALISPRPSATDLEATRATRRSFLVDTVRRALNIEGTGRIARDERGCDDPRTSISRAFRDTKPT